MTLVTDNATCFINKDFEEFSRSWNFKHVTLSPRYPKGNAHAEKAIGMVKQIYSRCEDPLFGMLVLKTVPLQDIKESPDKMFFGHALNTNLPRPTHVHRSYEERYINRSADGDVPATRNFQKNDLVWIKINDHLPWKPGVIVNIHPNQSFDVKVEDKVYRS